MTFNYATHGNVPTDDSGTMITPDNCDCEMCGSVVDCNKHNIYILQRGEEDMALCEFVCTSKIDVQRVLSEGLKLMAEES